jgi:hypothetical protein
MTLWTPDSGSIHCQICGASFRPNKVSADELAILLDHWYRRGYQKEKSLLLRTRSLCERHPEARGRVLRRISFLFEADDSDVKNKLIQGLPLAEIPMPAGTIPTGDELERWTEGDAELANFLRSTDCQLEERLASVEEQLANYEKQPMQPKPICPQCGQQALEFRDYGE